MVGHDLNRSDAICWIFWVCIWLVCCCAGETAINLVGDFNWDAHSEPFLTDADLVIPEGNLVAVVGSTGSGKSSLLSAMLGLMEQTAGPPVQLYGKVWSSTFSWLLFSPISYIDRLSGFQMSYHEILMSRYLQCLSLYISQTLSSLHLTSYWVNHTNNSCLSNLASSWQDLIITSKAPVILQGTSEVFCVCLSSVSPHSINYLVCHFAKWIRGSDHLQSKAWHSGKLVHSRLVFFKQNRHYQPNCGPIARN